MAGYAVTYTVVDNASKQIDAINRRIAQMRAPVERLSRQVTRFVDVSGLRKVAQGFDWIYKAAGSVLRTLSAIVPAMGAITGAASIAGIVHLVKVYSDWAHTLVQAADNIGITTQELQKLQDATTLAGGNASDMTESLKGLHTALTDMNIGRGNATETAQALNFLGVNARDASGHLRSASDLLPELIRKISELKDPADRARLATILLGGAGDKLVETFRQSSKSFGDWFNDASRYTALTADQIRQMQLFTEAQGRVGVAFDHLGQQIAAMVARDFGPLLNRFAEFVEKHTPDILAAVDRLSTRFSTWLAGIEWANVESGITRVIDGLAWVIRNLDTITTAAEVIAGLFVLKWGIDIVKAIGAVTQAIGLAGGGAVLGTGLLGALAGVAAIVATLALGAKYETPETRAAREKNRRDMGTQPPTNLPTSDYWIDAQGRKHDATTGEIIDGPPAPIQRQSGPAGYLPGGVTPASYGGATAASVGGNTIAFFDDMARAVTKGFEDAWDHILTRFASGGGGGAGGFTRASFSPPTQAGAPSPNVQSAVVRPSGPSTPFTGSQSEFYQKTYNDILEAAKAKNLPNPEVIARLGAAQASQETGYGRHVVGNNLFGIKAAGGVGTGSVEAMTNENLGGRNVRLPQKFAAFESTKESATGYVDFLLRNPRYKALLAARDDQAALDALGRSGYATDPNYQSSVGAIQRRHAATAATAPPVAAAPSVTVPPPKPVNGAVDVSITHKNAPPNSAVTATGSGSVNVAPVRVEHQNMADI